MGLILDTYWVCPGCGTKNHAQLYGEWEDPGELPVTALPIGRGLKWNPPCEKCEEYQLTDPPETFGPYPIKKINES